MKTSYRTVDAAVHHETERIKGSRFLADVFPAATQQEVAEVLEGIQRQQPKASHHCYAYRLGAEGSNFRVQDHGEPTGSAGRPILQQIDALELTDLGVVVTRYFGGTKLGVGGLMRAYGGAAAAALQQARIVVRTLHRQLQLHYPYDCERLVQTVLSAYQLRSNGAEYSTEVRLQVAVPLKIVEELSLALRDRTAGRIRVEESR
jgi:uncharacterized YigZ family protein